MNSRLTGTILLILLLAVSACDNGTPASPAVAPTVGGAATATSASPLNTAASATNVAPPTTLTSGNVEPTAIEVSPAGVAATEPAPTGSPVDAVVVPSPTTSGADIPAPTPVTSTATGEAITALAALTQLKPKALAWQSDARLVMLANVRPGQAPKLLGVALGDPDVNEPTPGGKGRNWALIVFSPSTKGAIALTMDGTQTDLVQQGALTDNMVQGFSSPGMAALELAKLDPARLVDSDKLPGMAGATGSLPSAGIAMLAPDGLGIGPLPTPKTGGSPPQIAYELFSADPNRQSFVFLDATTGDVVLDSSTP